MKQRVSNFRDRDMDIEERTTTVVASKEIPDKAGEVVSLDGLDCDQYLQNPIVLNGHRASEPVGIVKRLWREGADLLARVQFDDTAAGRWAFNVLRGGGGGVSIGFDSLSAGESSRAEKAKYGDGCKFVFRRALLQELSIVLFPVGNGTGIIHEGGGRGERASYTAHEMEKTISDTVGEFVQSDGFAQQVTDTVYQELVSAGAGDSFAKHMAESFYTNLRR